MQCSRAARRLAAQPSKYCGSITRLPWRCADCSFARECSSCLEPDPEDVLLATLEQNRLLTPAVSSNEKEEAHMRAMLHCFTHPWFSFCGFGRHPRRGHGSVSCQGRLASLSRRQRAKPLLTASADQPEQ